LAQSAQIAGRVVDSTGGIVSEVTITITNVETGVQRTTASNLEGNYAVPLLPPGNYQVRVEKQGFRPIARSGVILVVDQSARLDFVLEVGQITAVVDVTAEAPIVTTESGTLSQVIDERRIIDLPLNGRNAGELVFLTPGAIRDTRTRGTYVYGSSIVPDTHTPAVNGARSNGVAFRLDGANNNDNYTGVSNPFPNPDSLQEFSIQTSNFSAEYGNAPGGVVNIRTKSGTNEFHGTAFNFLRNGRLNARNFFASERDNLKRNQFGATVGGPIVRNRLFFFGSYQGTRVRETQGGLSQFAISDAMRAGDFSAVPGRLVDPLTGAEFPNRQIPAVRMDPVAVKLLDYMPRSSDPSGRVLYSLPNRSDFDEFLIKADQSLGKHQLYQRFYQYDLTEPSLLNDPNILTQVRNGRKLRVQTLAVNDVMMISPSLVNNFTFTYSHNRGGTDPNSPFGLPDLGAKLAQPEVPALAVSISGYAGISISHLARITRENVEFSDSLNWIRGKHQIQLGGTLLHLRQDIVNDFRKNGSWSFTNDFTGNSVANFLLGQTTTFQQGGGEYKALRGWRINLYAQDNYRVSPSLVLNLGVRLDPWLPYTDELGRITCLSPGNRSPRYPNAPDGLLYAGDPGCPDGGTATDFWNVAPRLGFAWSPGGKATMSVRGGYGVFFEQPETVLYNRFVNIAPFSPNFLFSGVPLSDPYAGVVNPFPDKYGPRNPPSDETFELPLLATSFEPRFATQYMQNWNLTVERQIAGDTVARAAYVGSKGTHLRLNIEANPAIYTPTATVANTQQRRLRSDFSSIIQTFAMGNSTYHALQLSLEKRFSSRLSILFNYTWGKSIDMNSTNTTQGSSNVPNPFDAPSNRGLSDYDVPHRFVLSPVYALPSFQNLTPALKAVLGGWQVSGICTWQSGFPFSITSGRDNSRSGVNQDRADFVGSGSPELGADRPKQQWLDRYFVTEAFEQNVVGTFGNSGRNILRGPKEFNIDFSAQKNFAITEAVKIQFRAEFFNFTNTPSFGLPSSSLTSPSYGRILSAGSPRITQFGVKIIY
jgi:hypothetical protein